MPTITTNVTREYRDLDLNFNIHPVKKDINKNVAERAVINSIKNLILTNRYERPFRPEISSNIRAMLFENLDIITASNLQREIQEVITNFEPRVRVIFVKVKPDFDNNGFSVDIEFLILNRTDPININFLLQRIR